MEKVLKTCARELMDKWLDLEAEAGQASQAAKDHRVGEAMLEESIAAILRKHFSPAPAGEGLPTTSIKLYEITALVNRSTVIAAVSKEDAMAHVETWEQAWEENSDLIGVSDVELFDVREVRELDEESIEDDAHNMTSAVRDFLRTLASQEKGTDQ